MEHKSSESIAQALQLLEDAAKEKKDELKHAMSDKYTHLKSAILETEHSLVKALSDAGRHTVEATAHAKDASVEKAQEIARDVDKCVHANPWPYIAGSAMAGLLVGSLLHRNAK